MRNYSTYYNSINGEDVEIGTLVWGAGPTIGKVVGFTMTQIKCVKLQADLETEMDSKFNLTKDRGLGGGGKKIGGRYEYFQPVTKEKAQEYLDRDRVERAKKKAEDDERQRAYEVKVAARKELMRPGYEARTLLNEDLGLWQMNTVNEKGDPVVICWTREMRHRRLSDGFYLKLGFWYRNRWGGETQGPASTTVDGTDELTALASRSYD